MSESTEVVELPEALIRQFAQMVTVIPDYEPGGGEKIYEQILSAKTLGDIDAPWSGGRNIPVGPMLYVTELAKAPSDYSGGLPFYLVVTTIMPSSGELKEYSVGATAVVAQLVKAHSLDELPIAGTIIETDIKRRPGQKAQHFKVDRDETDRVRASLNGKRGK